MKKIAADRNYRLRKMAQEHMISAGNIRQTVEWHIQNLYKQLENLRTKSPTGDRKIIHPDEINFVNKKS